jgi:hypothetical protein
MFHHVKKLVRWLWRSSITGRFVSRKYAEKHGDTTVKERV